MKRRIISTLALIAIGVATVACATPTNPTHDCGVTGGSQTCEPQ